MRIYVNEIKKQSGSKVDFQAVLAQLDKMDTAAKAFEQAMQKATVPTAEANRVLLQAERALVLDKGLPGRDWYRHQLYAPGMYTGYGAKTLPGIREAVEASRWEEANREAGAVATVLEAMNRRIGEATRLLDQ